MFEHLPDDVLDMLMVGVMAGCIEGALSYGGQATGDLVAGLAEELTRRGRKIALPYDWGEVDANGWVLACRA